MQSQEAFGYQTPFTGNDTFLDQNEKLVACQLFSSSIESLVIPESVKRRHLTFTIGERHVELEDRSTVLHGKYGDGSRVEVEVSKMVESTAAEEIESSSYSMFLVGYNESNIAIESHHYLLGADGWVTRYDSYRLPPMLNKNTEPQSTEEKLHRLKEILYEVHMNRELEKDMGVNGCCVSQLEIGKLLEFIGTLG